jgi:hypothetical protein
MNRRVAKPAWVESRNVRDQTIDVRGQVIPGVRYLHG